MEVTVKVKADTPAGRKLIRELDTNKNAQVHYPLPEHIAGTKTYTVEEVFDSLTDKLNAHYGTDYKLKYK